MRLNHDCIRDILLYIEKHTTDQLPIVSTENLIVDLQKHYDADTINYHIRQIHKGNLVDNVFYAEGVPQDICDLSWEGRKYVDNIRDPKVWMKLKEATKHLESVSLPIITAMAPEIIKHFLPKF